jgi:Leucine-rich repeat (LRR) protein
MLTSVLLMKALDVSQNQIDSYINKLKLVDPFRRSFYNDLRSKFLMESVLESWDKTSKELGLVGKGLTSLYHVEYVAHVTKFDVSNNQLRALHQAAYLHNVEEISAANNAVSTCQGIKHLATLSVLNLRNNNICHASALRDLQTCPGLTQLDLRDNPIVHVEGFRSAVLELLPQLTSLNGENIS